MLLRVCRRCVGVMRSDSLVIVVARMRRMGRGRVWIRKRVRGWGPVGGGGGEGEFGMDRGEGGGYLGGTGGMPWGGELGSGGRDRGLRQRGEA